MITVRPSGERGRADTCWLRALHTFSFGSYHDPAHTHFRALRVINEDRIAPGAGFDLHPHKHMEILTLVLEGAVEHADSLGNRALLRAGEIQRMTAGSGIFHSERNPSRTEPLHLLQIWIRPSRFDLEPSYEQKLIPAPTGPITLLATPDARDGSLRIHQDAVVLLARPGARIGLAPGRGAWIHAIRGPILASGVALAPGDSARVEDEPGVGFSGEGEALVFDLP